ncbi:AraC family transcriptional regulator [Caballeronia udeis]|uniref:AraC family transcriptional regulator n=1 Tax=Caballeronia udeis TaxID=1232866 RepID=A0A158H1M3_9BURK|nr:AraC family transcriptional regulator [Caballeronia udeis]
MTRVSPGLVATPVARLRCASRLRGFARPMRALEMLASGTAVTTIALDLGYENVSAFIAMFRRTFGVTPTQYFAELVPDRKEP